MDEQPSSPVYISRGVRHGDPKLLCEGWEDEEAPVNSLKTEDQPNSSQRAASGSALITNTTSVTAGNTKSSLKVAFVPRREADIRCAWKANEPAHRKMSAVPHGYQEYLEALADPKHEEHASWMEWRGPFDPEKFDAQAATKRMRKGLPNWREME